MRTLLRRLVDDAALFPPGNAPMARAVRAHREAGQSPYAPLIGRFLCPATRVPELRAHLGADDRIELGLIADTGLAGLPAALAAVRADPRLRLTAIEIALPPDADQARAAAETTDGLPGEIFAFVELPRVPGWREALDRLADTGNGAKLRTGGARPDMFPTPAEVADFVAACARRRVPFKCTAGLHHAVRHTDPVSGFAHHGFLNILLAACHAVSGPAAPGGPGGPGGPEADEPPDSDLAAVLARTDETALAGAARAVDGDTARAARGLFAGYGSCSIDEPRTDLLRLGVMREGDQP